MKNILYIYIAFKKLIFGVLVIMVILIHYIPSYSQSTYTLQSSSCYILYSKEANKIIKAFQSDSVHFTNGDSVFYLHPNILTTKSDSAYCLQLKYNLFSKKVIKKTSGNLVFFNQRQDSIFINTQSPLNSEWVFYKDTSSRFFTAKITGMDTMTLLPGLVDSVKIITLTCVNGNTNCIFTDPLIISKNYGFINLYPLFYFPDIERAYDSDYIIYNNMFEFIGEKNPNIGLYHLDAFDIYDYDVGDEFHTGYYYRFYNYNGSTTTVDISTRQEVIMVTNKKISLNKDSVIYSIKRCEIATSNHSDTLRKKDTLQFIVTNENLLYNNFPDDYILLLPGSYSMRHIHYLYDYLLGFTAIEQRLSEYHKTNDTIDCWNPLITFDNCDYSSGYYQYEGLWGDNYYCNGFLITQTNSLVYFKKANQTWGTPLNTCDLITSNDTKPLLINQFSIFPNPAQNTIQINAQSRNEAYSSIQVFDYTGKLILIKKSLNQKTTEIDITGLTEGYYYIIITDTNQQRQFEKFIKIK